MPYSLVSRFEGALLGAALGEALGTYALTTHLSEVALSKSLRCWHPGLAAKPSLLPINRALLTNAELITQQGIWQPTQAQPPEPVNNGLALAIATLPVILLHHDNDWLLRQQILQTATAWQIAASAQLGWLTLSEAIAHSLQPPQTSSALLNQLIVSCAIAAPEMVAGLERLQVWQQQANSLHSALSELIGMELDAANRAVILALYCFLQTPTDLQLALVRAARLQYFPQLICPLVGALVGAFGGRDTMPLSWGIVLSAQTGGGVSAKVLGQLAEHLFLAWAGVLVAGRGNRETAIAAPTSIHSR